MSFVTRSIIRAPPRVLTQRTTIRGIAQTSPSLKSATETVKDGLKAVDKAVASKIVNGITAGGLSFGFRDHRLTPC